MTFLFFDKFETHSLTFQQTHFFNLIPASTILNQRFKPMIDASLLRGWTQQLFLLLKPRTICSTLSSGKLPSNPDSITKTAFVSFRCLNRLLSQTTFLSRMVRVKLHSIIFQRFSLFRCNSYSGERLKIPSDGEFIPADEYDPILFLISTR